MATRRTDGFNDAGTMYSVATDFDKQLAQAAASFDAASKEARLNRIGQEQRGNVVNPQEEAGNLDVLRRELFDPVIMSEAAYQGRTYHPDRTVRPTANRIVSDRGNIWAVDPTSGAVKQVVTAPAKAAAEAKPNYAQRNIVDDLNKQIDMNRKQQMALGGGMTESVVAQRFDLKNKEIELQRQRKKILDAFMGDSHPNPIATTNAAPPVAVAPPAMTNAPEAGKIVIQKGHRFQLNPNGPAIDLGPVAR